MKPWLKIILGMLICLLGTWLVLNRPDAGLWTGSKETLPSAAATAAPAIFSGK